MNRSTNKPERHRVFKLIFVPLVIFSLLAQCALVWTQLEDIRDGYFDFVLYYSGAKIINDGNGAQLYNLEVQREYQKEFAGGDKDWDLPFNHPPYELLTLLILRSHASYAYQPSRAPNFIQASAESNRVRF